MKVMCMKSEYLKALASLLAILSFSCVVSAQDMNIQAPAWVNPTTVNADITGNEFDVYTVNAQNPLLQWTPPVVSSDPAATYTYDLRIVELVEGQPVDYLMEHAPVFFKKRGLIVPQLVIPAKILNNFHPGVLYAAQVTARPRSATTAPAQTMGANPIPGPILVFSLTPKEK